jgi:hypothetical protein
MNKITPHKLRDLHFTLPTGTECYLCSTARKALSHYRKGYESKIFLDKNQALSMIAQKLGRGLTRFLQGDMQIAVSAYQKGRDERAAQTFQSTS